MAITLYKPGKSHVIRGHECIAKNFETKHLKAALHAGWFTDPANMKAKPGRKPNDPLPDREPLPGNQNAAKVRRNQ